MTILTELQRSEDREGPWKLYIYEPNSQYHSGGIWFGKKLRYPDEEITLAEARRRCENAVGIGREVRICDGGDKLVFHFDRKQVVHGEKFWEEVSK